MTSDLSIFAARLRELIPALAGGHCSINAPISSGNTARSNQGNDDELPFSDAEFNAYAMDLLALQFKHNTPYRKFCESRGVFPDSVTHWTQIPAIPTSAFKELELTSLPPEQRATVFHSSGTTEQLPSRHFHNAESLAVYETSLLWWFQLHSASNEQLLILTPPLIQAPHSSLVHMFDTIRRDSGAPESAFVANTTTNGAWTLDCDATIGALQTAIASGKPLHMLGTAFSLVHLLDYLSEKNITFKLPADSRVMETGGYKGRSRSMPKVDLHKLIRQHLGVNRSRVICEYGMSELSSQAYAYQSSLFTDHFHFPSWARVQIMCPETGREVADGETGLIRVFDLANVFSVMAIQTEDLAVRRGTGFELIGRAEHAKPRGCSLMAV